MICALLLGREGSSGFPGKNLYPVLGRPLAAYPMMVATSSPSVGRLYVSTDSPALKQLATNLGAEIIDRPPHLASKQALGEHAYVHGYQVIRERLAREGHELEMLVLLFANAATLTPQIVEEGIRVLRANPSFDSAVSVSCYNMWSPLRARRVNGEGLLDPFVPFETFGDPKTMNCDRDSQGDVWFADMGLSIVRPRCLDNLDAGLLPQKWMGQKIYPLKQWGGLDVDEPWQIPAVEAWLEAHEISKLFQVQRIKWDHLYDSEKTVLSTLELSKHSRVLDMGIDPGGLGVALRERFGVKSYVALVSDPAVGSEAKAVYPESEVVVACAEEYFADQLNAFDLVCVFGAEDSPDFLDNIIPKAYASLKPGGSLLLRVRLTDAPTIQDVQLSSQKVFTRKGLVETNRYIVRNTHEVLDSLRKLSPARIFAYGYSGVPSSTATTPFKIVCFGVFAVTRPGPGGPTEPQIELRLPGHAVRQTC